MCLNNRQCNYRSRIFKVARHVVPSMREKVRSTAESLIAEVFQTRHEVPMGSTCRRNLFENLCKTLERAIGQLRTLRLDERSQVAPAW